MKNTPQFLASEIEPREAARCRFQVIPVPYEATVSYGGGTALGPEAILEASCQLEAWTGRGLPLKQGIFTWPAVDCSGSTEEVLERIEAGVAEAFAAGPQGGLPVISKCESDDENCLCAGAACLPVILGGEHSVTLGMLRALKKRYGHFGVIQFDAHADLRDSYEGSPYSHACVMRRAVDGLGLALFQVGVRSLSPAEVEFRKIKDIPHLDARQAMFPLPGELPGLPGPSGFWRADSSMRHSGALAAENPKNLLSGIIPADFPRLVFLTFDIDALDASLMPATGTPEPGGLFWWDALRLIEAALAGRVCLGFDVVELAPIAGLHAPDFTAARLVYEIMGILDAR